MTTAPIVRAPNWKLPFEVMCDASNLTIGAVLGQREERKPYVVYYASKALNEVQRNYTTTEKELLTVVSHPDPRSDPNGRSEPGPGRETIYWDSH